MVGAGRLHAMFFINSNRPAHWLPNWSSYFITGLMALMISFVFGALTGCRFGNNQTTTSTTGVDTISGYYETLPQSLSLTVTTGTQTNTTSVTTNFMPASLSAVMTNPIAVVIQNPVNGQGLITNQSGTNGYSIYVTGSNTSLAYSESATTQWMTNCTETDTAVRQGSYSQYQTGPKLVEGVNSLGRVSLNITDSFAWVGTDCASLATTFNTCFVNQDTCWGTTAVDRENENTDLHSVFDPFINSGVMTVDQIKTVTGISYQVDYQ